MASLAERIPLPFLLHSLLASSWTWLALSLATIATVLRALSRLSLVRHRPGPLLAPSPALLFAQTRQLTAAISALPSKRRRRCKSTPSLQALPLAFGSREASPRPLRRTASSSEIRRGGAAGGAPKLCTPDFAAGAESASGFLVDSEEERISEAPSQDRRDKASPACLPLQSCSFHVPLFLSETTPFFEAQFGWLQLLDMKRGSQWQAQPWPSQAWPGRTVKLWSSHERNILQVLNVDRRLVCALDVDIYNSFACIGQENGGISLWDIANQACLARVFQDVSMRVSALRWKTDFRLAIAASSSAVKLWDIRSPTLVPLWNGEAVLDGCEVAPCEGNIIGNFQGRDSCLLCDIRKAHMDSVTEARMTPSTVLAARMQTMQSFTAWEKPSFDDEELSDDPGWTVSSAHDRSNDSFTERCVTLVRSLSSSGRVMAPSAS